jgi:hypothetical protein
MLNIIRYIFTQKYPRASGLPVFAVWITLGKAVKFASRWKLGDH